VPAGPQETTTSSPDLAPFIKSRAFADWEGEVSRIMVPSGHRFGFNTPSMDAYWQRLTHAMVEYVNIGRSDKTPISSHRKSQTSNPCLSPLSQSAIAYGNNQKLGFAEWDEIRGGWIAYTTHLPEGWRESVNIVEESLIMPSKRDKGNKRDAPVDPAVEKGPKRPAYSPKKTPSKKTKAGKKSKFATPAPEPGKESAATPTKTVIESTAAPSKAKGVATSSSRRKSGKKNVALHPSKGQKKAGTSSFSPNEEQPSVVPTRPPSKKKKLVIPPPPSGIATRTSSKSGFKVSLFFLLFIYCFYFAVLCCVFLFFCLRQAMHKPGKSGDVVVVVEVTFVHSFLFCFLFGLDPYCLTFVV
jgi:hypothetical protein